jgi:hypothetical protein
MSHIQIDDISPIITYTVGASSRSSFPIPFAWFANSDLVVTAGDDTLVLSTDYTVDGITIPGGFSSGTLTLVDAVTDTDVTIERVLPIERTTDFPNSGPFDIPALNTQFDKIVAICQQLLSSITQNAAIAALTATVNAWIATVEAALTGDLLTVNFPTRTTAAAATISALTSYLRTAGYATAGDGGAALYARTTALVTGGFQSADGAYWVIAEPAIVTAEQIGAKGDATTVTGATTIASGSGVLTIVGGSFVSADVNKLILVPGAGAAGADLITTILGVAGLTQVSLANNAGTALVAVSKTVAYGTNDTTALQAMIDVALANKIEARLNAKTYAFTSLTISAAMMLRGLGPASVNRDGSTLANFSLTADAITVSAAQVTLENFTVRYPGTNTSRAASTNGLTIESIAARTALKDLIIANQYDGIYDMAGALAVDVVANGNAAYGWTIDGSDELPGGFLGEIVLDNCQSNENVNSGFRFVAGITGIFAKRLTAVSNGGNGVETAGTAVNDVYIEQPEIGFNGTDGINHTATGTSFAVSGGLIEHNGDAGIRTSSTAELVAIAGVTITSGVRGVVIAGGAGSVTGCVMRDLSRASIVAEATEVNLVISGIAADQCGTFGIECVAGSGAVMVGLSTFSGAGTAISGAAAGSKIRGVAGIADV